MPEPPSLPPGFYPVPSHAPRPRLGVEAPGWARDLFRDACRQLAYERGLPILDADLEERMDRLAG